MGQGLVISIRKDGEELANAYYHRAGYTEDAMELVSKCLVGYEDYHNQVKGSDPMLQAFYMLSASGAGFIDGFREEERAIAKKMYPTFGFNVADKNQGWISISKEEREKALIIDDVYADVEIDIDRGIIDFSLACDYYGDSPIPAKIAGVDLENIPVLDYDLNAIAFADWDSFCDDLGMIHGFFLDRTDCYYETIE